MNAPGPVREFVFSPAVGRSLQGPDARAGPTAWELEEVRRFGEGRLTILDYGPTEAIPGEQAALTWMRARVEIVWAPAAAGRVRAR